MTDAGRLKSINPKNGELVQEFDATTGAAIEQALETAERAFETQGRSSFDDRARWLRIEKCARICRHYADNGEAMLADVSLESDAKRSAVMHLPIGPVLAVMPWNFPFWQVFRAAAPAVMAGNAVLLKHASNVPRTALALQSVFESAGLPVGVFQSLLIGPDQVARLLADRRVKASTVTGSMRAGASVAEIAGKHLKKTVLELGGSDPFIVMPSANLEQALDTAVTARMLNNGQSCIAAKRFIVHAAVFDRFVDGFVERFEALSVGDPVSKTTDMGPLAMDRLRRRLEAQVETLIERGAATREMDRAFREIEAGATFVNQLVKSDPRLPFGGIKQSGYGRELARDGIIEFVNRKTAVVG